MTAIVVISRGISIGMVPTVQFAAAEQIREQAVNQSCTREHQCRSSGAAAVSTLTLSILLYKSDSFRQTRLSPLRFLHRGALLFFAPAFTEQIHPGSLAHADASTLSKSLGRFSTPPPKKNITLISHVSAAVNKTQTLTCYDGAAMYIHTYITCVAGDASEVRPLTLLNVGC